MYCLQIRSFSRSRQHYFHTIQGAMSRADRIAETKVTWFDSEDGFISDPEFMKEWDVTVEFTIEEIKFEDEAAAK